MYQLKHLCIPVKENKKQANKKTQIAAKPILSIICVDKLPCHLLPKAREREVRRSLLLSASGGHLKASSPLGKCSWSLLLSYCEEL